MADMTGNVHRPYKMNGHGHLATFNQPLAGYTNYGAGNAGFTVYKGAILVVDTSDTPGYASPFLAALTAAVDDVFAGISLERQVVDSSMLADGSRKCAVARNGLWGFPIGSFTQADQGKLVFASDDGTITLTATGNLWIGRVAEVDTVHVWVNIEEAAGALSVHTA